MRSLQIVQAVPRHTLLNILSAIQPRPEPPAHSDAHTHAHMHAQLVHLLLLLPPAYHPAVLRARCPEILRGRALTLPELPEYDGLDDSSPARASLTTQALAAAAVFAGGQPQRVGHPGAQPSAGPDPRLAPHAFPTDELGRRPQKRARGAQAAEEQPCGARTHARTPSAAALGGPSAAAPAPGLAADAALTRLDLTLPPHNPRRACTALARLRTLRELNVTIPGSGIPPAVSSMHALRDLRRLRVSGPGCDVKDPDAAALLTGIGAMPRLEDLTLDGNVSFGCHACGHPCRACTMPERMRSAAQQLSRLSALTRLGISHAHVCGSCTRVFADALQHLPRLAELRLLAVDPFATYGLFTECMEGGDVEAELSGCMRPQRPQRPPGLGEIVCGSAGFSALRSVAVQRAFSTRPSHWLRCRGRGVLQQLTALDLSDNSFLKSECKALTGLVGGLWALRRLDVSENVCEDGGLLWLAEVVPEMTALTSLDVGTNDATHVGVLTVMEAAGELQAEEGGGGLRRLGISRTRFLSRHARKLAKRLRPLQRLEALVMRDCAVAGDALGAVLRALAELPHLRVVDVACAQPRVMECGVPAELFAALPALQRLTISCTDAEHDEIARAVPGVTVARSNRSWPR